ncbi:MAG: hypothetical protein Q8Q23_02720 [bacterium]|nr:hypothetical protein [bacterium]
MDEEKYRVVFHKTSSEFFCHEITWIIVVTADAVESPDNKLTLSEPMTRREIKAKFVARTRGKEGICVVNQNNKLIRYPPY